MATVSIPIVDWLDKPQSFYFAQGYEDRFLWNTVVANDTRRQQTMSEKIVQLNEEVIKGQIKELVRGSVEETLNELLEAKAEKLTQAARYERNEQRQGYRSGHYSRVILLLLLGMSHSRCPNSRGYPLKLLLSSGTAAGRAVWRRPSSRCTWLEYPSAE